MKKLISYLICVSLICSAFLCGCSDAGQQSAVSEENISKTETSSVVDSDVSSVTETESSDTQSIAEPENNSEKPDGQEYHFLPILNKEDIDYMGIPYKDLTPEQVIQMWAQCTRERNWQKRYVIEKHRQNEAEQYGCPDRIFDCYGRLFQCFYDVEISRFYTGWDDENPERQYYSITARVAYYDCLSDNENHIGLEDPKSTRIITMEKTDGYWFIAGIGTSAPIDPDILAEMVSSDTESKVEEEKDNSIFGDPDYYLDIFGDRGYSFLPILNEDDIDYMGIPYKDLTPEQVIQMWAQCTRERNWQKRYVIEKYMYENADDYMEQDIIFDAQGGLNGCYYDVEISDWYPEGNAENAKRLYFRINSRIVFYSYLSDNDDHVQLEQTDLIQCVELEKIDGYWRIVGISTSGPADFDRVTDTVQ